MNAAPTPYAKRQTLLYTADHGGQFIPAFPEIHGMQCTGWSADDLMLKYHEAMTALAKITSGDFSSSEADEIASAVFVAHNEMAYNFYDAGEEVEP